MAVVRTLSPTATGSRPWSWAELVAETAGLGDLAGLEVTVRCKDPIPPGWRLVVQELSIDDPYRGPTAAAQRSVAGDALRLGMTLKLYRALPTDRTEIVAWIEPGSATLEYDGLRAGPRAAAWLARGVARRGTASLRLQPSPALPGSAAAA